MARSQLDEWTWQFIQRGPQFSYARLFGLALVPFINRQTMRGWPSLDTMADAMQVNRRTAGKGASICERDGWLSIEKRRGSGQHWKVNEYHLVIPAEAGAPGDPPLPLKSQKGSAPGNPPYEGGARNAEGGAPQVEGGAPDDKKVVHHDPTNLGLNYMNKLEQNSEIERQHQNPAAPVDLNARARALGQKPRGSNETAQAFAMRLLRAETRRRRSLDEQEKGAAA